MYQREEGTAKVNNEKQGLNVLGQEQCNAICDQFNFKHQYFN